MGVFFSNGLNFLVFIFKNDQNNKPNQSIAKKVNYLQFYVSINLNNHTFITSFLCGIKLLKKVSLLFSLLSDQPEMFCCKCMVYRVLQLQLGSLLNISGVSCITKLWSFIFHSSFVQLISPSFLVLSEGSHRQCSKAHKEREIKI